MAEVRPKGARPLRLLESFDSVRLSWSAHAENAQVRRALTQQQTLEVLFVLAFGSDLVVPQPYAVDSLGFLHLLRDIDAAHDLVAKDWSRADGHVPAFPVRLHLFGVESFAEAVVSMLSRIDATQQPFHSSLLPELNAHPDRLASKAARAVSASREITRLFELLPTQPGASHDDREELLRVLWKRFGTAGARDARRVVEPVPVAGRTIPELVAAVVQVGAPHRDAIVGADDQTLRDLQPLLSALSELAATSDGSEPFVQRSRLRADIPWSAGSPSAKDLLGDRVELVKEFSDAAYNLAIADSIGVATFASSTALDGSDKVAARLLARDLAHRAALVLEGEFRSLPTTSGSDPVPYRLDIDLDDTKDAANARLDQLLRKQAVEAFAAILRAREQADWQDNLAAMATARREGDERSYARSIEHHGEKMAHAVGDVIDVHVDGTGAARGVRLSAKLAAAGALGAASQATGFFSPGLAIGSAAALAVAGSAGEAHAYLTRRRSKRQIKTALGRLLAAPADRARR